MTKAQVVSEIVSKTGIEKMVVIEAVEAFLSVIKKSLAKRGNVYLRGFGSFIVKKRARKLGRNISKNTAIIIPEHYIPAFKPSKQFISSIKNGNYTA